MSLTIPILLEPMYRALRPLWSPIPAGHSERHLAPEALLCPLIANTVSLKLSSGSQGKELKRLYERSTP